MKNKLALAIHGGAGTILRSHLTQEQENLYKSALKEALTLGYAILKKGGTSVEAVTEAVRSLEDTPLFNAGRGSVFGNDGTQEMEASMMCGATLQAGAVAGIRNLRNPIMLCKEVLQDPSVVFLSGNGAANYARERKLPFEKDEYFFTSFRHEQLMAAKNEGKIVLDHDGERKFGTVGAVALDAHGNLAAATSTGGLTNKKYGRLGDSSVIGSGTYANNATCAVSCTGYGEFFLRAVVAHDISALMEYGNLSLEEAAHKVVNDKLVKMGGEGGIISVDRQGNISLTFNSEGMYRGMVSSDTEHYHVAIYES